MIPLIQFDGKTNTLGEWEAGKKRVGVSAGGRWGGTRGASKKGDGVGEEDKRKKLKLEKVGGAEGVEASGDIQFQVEVVK